MRRQPRFTPPTGLFPQEKSQPVEKTPQQKAAETRARNRAKAEAENTPEPPVPSDEAIGEAQEQLADGEHPDNNDTGDAPEEDEEQ